VDQLGLTTQGEYGSLAARSFDCIKLRCSQQLSDRKYGKSEVLEPSGSRRLFDVNKAAIPAPVTVYADASAPNSTITFFDLNAGWVFRAKTLGQNFPIM
jgi:hypothetical protein